VMEAYARETGFPIIGAASGYLCYQTARLAGARRVFELGSGYGYSTSWFARAVSENGGGEVYHVVWNEDLSRQARRHLTALGYGVPGSNVTVHYVVSEAIQALKATEGPFDLIFNDIDHRQRLGGTLIVDNLLWSGKIFDSQDHSTNTTAIREFTRQMTTHPGWITTIVPIRDGVLIAYKK
jgi:caffeoyl-CoA O-methyltransferase